MSTWNEASVATELLACEVERRDREKFTDDWPGLDLATAYRIQDETLRRRVARGERITGVKLGLTSEAKQRRMGVNTPLIAWLTDAMALTPGAPVPQHALIHPRIEPEIVFVMSRSLQGPGVDAAAAMEAVSAVHAGAEVIDSRYRDFKFTAADVVADNASAAAYVVSSNGHDPLQVDIVGEEVTLSVEGQPVHHARGADVLGSPAEALALAANELGARGIAIEAGWIVLTGGMSDAVVATSGTTVRCDFSTLGTIELACGSAD